MPSKNPKPPQERQETDLSLDVERRRTDSEFGKRQTDAAQVSEAVVRRARERAADVLEGARELADEVRASEGVSGAQTSCTPKQNDSQPRTR